MKPERREKERAWNQDVHVKGEGRREEEVEKACRGRKRENAGEEKPGLGTLWQEWGKKGDMTNSFD